MSTFDRVRKVLVDKLEVTEEEVTAEASVMDDLGADSLDVVEIVMQLEEEFEVEISDEEAEGLKTVQQIINYIDDKQKS